MKPWVGSIGQPVAQSMTIRKAKIIGAMWGKTPISLSMRRGGLTKFDA